MCTKPKLPSIVQDDDEEKEVIKKAVQADASLQKASVENRIGIKGSVNPNIKTTNNGIEDDINASKKKLLGE
jgi:hypothetical protein